MPAEETQKKSKILFVDDEHNVLSGFKRQFHRIYAVSTSDSPLDALKIVQQKGPFAVVVADMRMPKMDGVHFLREVRKKAPETVRVMLTGHADMDAAMAAVNEGHVFRFLTKPCPPESLQKALIACLEQYRLVRAEKELLHGTLRGSINVLTEVLSLVNPEAFGRSSRIKRYVRQLGDHFQIKQTWRLEMAAMLSQIGCVILPQETLKKLYDGKVLSLEEQQLFDMHPSLGSNLLSNIPKLEEVARIIALQEKHYDGGGFPDDALKGEDIPVGARVLKAVLDFDLLLSAGEKKHQAFASLQELSGSVYDPKILKALEKVLGVEAHFEVKKMSLNQLCQGMIFGQEVRTDTNILLVSKGQEVSKPLLIRLENFAENFGIEEPLEMLLPLPLRENVNK